MSQSKDSVFESEGYFGILSAILLILAFACHFYYAAVTAVDVPFWDDWNWFPEKNFGWIYAFDNEHRCVPTRILLRLQLAINGWDIRSGIIINFILFGLTLFAYVRFILWNAKLAPKWSVYLLSICVLSPLAIEIHHWGIGSAWHFPILFGVLGICQMFRPDITTTRDIMGSFMLVLCMYSVGHGLILSFVIMMTWIMYRIGLTRNNVDFQSIKVFVARMSPAVGIYLVALILWFYGYKKVPGHELPTGPWTPQFWNFLGILLQNGIAMPRRVSLYAPWIGFLILIPYFVIPSCYFMGRHIFTRRIISPGTAAIIAFNFGLLGVAAVISYGRGNFPVGFTTSGRYLIFLLYLIPVSALLWAELLASRKRLHRAWLIISCILFLVLQLRLIRSFGQYDNNMLVRQEHLRLIKEYYQGMGPRPLYLPGFWVPVDEYLDIAKQRNRSFYRKMNTVGSLK